jgi:hypothetical protein
MHLKCSTANLVLIRLNYFLLSKGPPNRIRSGFKNSGMHFLGEAGKHRTIAGRQIIHLEPMAADSDGVQCFPDLFHPGLGPEIAPFVMAIPFPASHQINPVRPLFKGSHDMEPIDFAGAGNPNNLYARRITQAHRTCQVRSRVPSEITAESDNDRFKLLAHKTPSNNVSILHKSWSSSYQFNSMALAGHSAAQMPQPWHKASSISLNPSALILGTP